MDLAPGTRLRSVTCDTQIVIVRAPRGADVDLWCGGAPMVPLDADAATSHDVTHSGRGTAIGKRYYDEEQEIEVLCTRAGRGDLSVAGTLLELQEARALPASD